MRLLVDARPMAETNLGGVGRVTERLVTAYAEAFPDDEIVCATTGSRKPSLPQALLSSPNVVHVHLNVPNKLWSAAACFGLVSFADSIERRTGKIDSVFLPNIGFIGNMQHRPYTLLLHDLSFLIDPKWFTRKTRWWHRAVHASDLIRGASHLFAVSECTKRDATRLLGIPSDRIDVIPLGPTLFPDQATSYQLPATHYVLALGSGDPRKNSATAIKAVEALRKEQGHEDLELILVGAGSPRPGRGNRAPKWIQYVARPSDDQLSDLYRNASVFLYPSWYEGYGLPLHEAASFGTPCVASTAGALPETAPLGSIFADPAKPHHWVEAIQLSLKGPREPLFSSHENWKSAVVLIRGRLH